MIEHNSQQSPWLLYPPKSLNLITVLNISCHINYCMLQTIFWAFHLQTCSHIFHSLTSWNQLSFPKFSLSLNSLSVSCRKVSSASAPQSLSSCSSSSLSSCKQRTLSKSFFFCTKVSSFCYFGFEGIILIIHSVTQISSSISCPLPPSSFWQNLAPAVRYLALRYLLQHLTCLHQTKLGVGIAQWLECQTHAWKVTSLSPCGSGWIIFFSRFNFLCWHLFWYLFHPCVNAVACERSRSFWQKCRWQITAKHAYTLLFGFAWSDMVHGCMVYTECAEMAAISCGTSHASAVSTPLRWTFKNAL